MSMLTSSDKFSEQTTAVADRLEPARERALQARERAAEGAGIARERAAEGLEIARERATEGVEHASEAIQPLWRRVSALVASLVTTVLSLAAAGTGTASRALTAVSSAAGSLAEQGREVADKVEPSKAERRRGKLRSVGLFAGGFAAGAATGYVIKARSESHGPQPSVTGAPGAGSTYGQEAAAIDARRDDLANR